MFRVNNRVVTFLFESENVDPVGQLKDSVVERPISCGLRCGDCVNQLKSTLFKERDLALAGAVFVTKDLVVIVLVEYCVTKRKVSGDLGTRLSTSDQISLRYF